MRCLGVLVSYQKMSLAFIYSSDTLFCCSGIIVSAIILEDAAGIRSALFDVAGQELNLF